MRKKHTVYALYIVLVIVFLIAYYINSSIPAGSSNKSVNVVIPANTTALGIAKILKENKVIKNEYFFMLYLKINGKGNNFKAGKYQLKQDMPYKDIVDILTKGSNISEYVKLTIPEGYTVAQIADKLSQMGWSRNEFLKECKVGIFDYAFLKDIPSNRPYRLEGYLFPDTYFIKKQTSEHQVIDMMLKRFDDVVVKYYNAQNKRIPLDEVVIVASMIEKEARIDIDRPLIASVIYNRLNKGMKLQVDATVLYALGIQKDRLTLKDLEFKSPYNTYYVKGLPIGPISNPGYKSIQAALNPAKTGYYYYVARGDGSHVFSRSYDQHLNAIKAIEKGSVVR